MPVLKTPLRSFSRFSFSFSRALRSFHRSSCFSLSSTAPAVGKKKPQNQTVKDKLIGKNGKKNDSSSWAATYKLLGWFEFYVIEKEVSRFATFVLLRVLSWMHDMLAIAMEASREETSSSGSSSSCLRVFTARSRFSFWDWDLLRDIFTLSMDTLVSRWRRWPNRDSMFIYLQKNSKRNRTWYPIGGT